MTKTSTTKSVDRPGGAETHGVPRIAARELLRVLHMLDGPSETTLEKIRIHFCVDKGVRRSGTALFTTARDAANALDRLGLLSGGPFPKDRRLYQQAKDRPLRLTGEGRALLDTLARSRAEAYDELFRKMYAAHRYLRLFVRHIANNELFVPTITSTERDVSERYARHVVLADDVAAKRLDTDSLVQKLASRMRAALSPEQTDRLRGGTTRLVEDMAGAALVEDPTAFAKNFLHRLNDVVLPIVLDGTGLTFDYRTHRAIWDLGTAFRLWWGTSVHPEFNGRIIFRTATLQPAPELGTAIDFAFDSGVDALREEFLERLFVAYQDLQRRDGATYVKAWELRAIFCQTNRCQGSVFNTLFGEHFNGNSSYEIHTEIRRQWPQHEDALRAGERNIGTVRVVRK